MKTKLFFAIALAFGIGTSLLSQTSVKSPQEYDFPYVEVVATQEKIWLMPEEMPVENLLVRVLDADGMQVLKKSFSSKTKDWSVDVSELPSGKYRILIGNRQVEYLDKRGRKGML